MGTTPTYGFRYPEPTDLVTDGALNIRQLAEDVEADLAAHEAAANSAYVAKTDVDSAVVLTAQSTTSTSFTDLATVGPVSTKRIGPSGRALVIVSAQQTNPTGYAIMSFSASGPTPVVASDDAALTTSSAIEVSADRATLVTGLAEGDYTFTAKYRVPGGTGTFQRRRITVIPL